MNKKQQPPAPPPVTTFRRTPAVVQWLHAFVQWKKKKRPTGTKAAERERLRQAHALARRRLKLQHQHALADQKSIYIQHLNAELAAQADGLGRKNARIRLKDAFNTTCFLLRERQLQEEKDLQEKQAAELVMRLGHGRPIENLLDEARWLLNGWHETMGEKLYEQGPPAEYLPPGFVWPAGSGNDEVADGEE